uniref:Acyl-CoA desaturase n=1 Tax=Cacopsylla melanoneura TaxID=428564 RepID=A0A8D9F423_9HEMI
MEWSRDHRVHHKYSDTNADPYNINRGFFFSHIGWLMVKKHPELLEKGRGIDLSDLYADKVVMFQKRHYPKLVLFISFFLPTIIPMLFWGETLSNAWHVSTILRIVVNLNAAFVINSFAHMYGQKPYEKAIAPAENLAMAIFSLGEGMHNVGNSYFLATIHLFSSTLICQKVFSCYETFELTSSYLFIIIFHVITNNIFLIFQAGTTSITSSLGTTKHPSLANIPPM